MLENIIKKEGNLYKLIKNIQNKQISVFGCGENERLAIIDSLDSFILYVTPSINDAIRIKEQLENVGKSCEILNPMFNFGVSTFFDYAKLNKTLNNIIFENINALVMPIEALISKYPNVDNYLSKLTIKSGDVLNRENIVSLLIQMGYTKTQEIEKCGEFRVFGDIIDVYDICSELPYRISFFDDEVEYIYSVTKEFEKVGNYDEIEIFSNNFIKEIELAKINSEVKSALAKATENSQINSLNGILDIVNTGSKNPFLHVYSNIASCIFEYLPKNSTIVLDDTKILYDNLTNYIKDEQEYIESEIKQGNLLVSHKDIYFSLKELLNKLQANESVLAFQMLTNANKFFNPQMVFSLKTIPVGNYVNKSSVLVNDLSSYLATKNTVILYVKNKDNIPTFTKLINANRLPCVETASSRNIISNTINIIPQSYNLSYGFREENLVVIGCNKLFGVKKPNKIVNYKKQTEEYLPQPNDYVVHETHGVGKYMGVENLKVNNTQKDYLVIEYKNHDKLYLPVEYTNRLSKYVGGNDIPHLNKLGGVEFANIKSKVKNSLKELAFNLVELYKKREESKGYKYPKEEELELAFKNSFPYTETVDQQKAIDDIVFDMESGKVMDRLICGDVGYGKTEVALRAIFKTVIADKQCMFMCPTTVLSQQHYNTCLSRLQDFGIKVEVLNRFKTKAQVTDIINKLASGDIDVICGTHKLLGKDVKFKDLGLLVLDEEQKFGVGDKEKIKNIKNNINVLTLSATPIPRTLHMSMVGIRDISIINTPPENRLNVATTVTEYSDELLKNAIEKELNRGGQVLVIYNRVEGIYNIANHISGMFNNEIAVDVAHGQMGQELLEDAIYKLYNGNTQVLIATTLIENGVDLPKANTLFIIDADILGLSQLYQLKGRVGRNNIQAYAYFTYQNYKILNSDAYKRLQAILEYSDMGSGYKIAMRDLEIRGAGNVLGPEQHGHMVKVGYAMYINLLNQAIEEVKQNKELKNNIDTKIETNLPAYLPDNFVTQEDFKIGLYNEISNVKNTTEFVNLISKLKEVYKDIPFELVNLVKVALIKNMATMLNVEKVTIKQNGAFLQFRKMEEMLNDKISDAVNVYKQNVVLNLTNLPIIEFVNVNANNVMEIIIDFLNYII